MDYTRFLDVLPLWLLFPLTIALVIGAVELGYRVGRRRRRFEAGGEPEKDAPVGAIVAATLGLLAFMLGFTFSLAASRFDDRRRIVIDESNAMGTTYLRAGMLPEPHASSVQPLLREFVEVRLSMVDPTAIEAGLARSAELQQRLWAEATATFNEDPHSLVAGLFTQALNEMIDLHAKRNMFALHSRLPELVWLVLYLIALTAMMSLGYQQGLSGSRRSLAVGALALTFSAVILLIADLDRPQQGLLRVSQRSMRDLQRSMAAPTAEPQK